MREPACARTPGLGTVLPGTDIAGKQWQCSHWGKSIGRCDGSQAWEWRRWVRGSHCCLDSPCRDWDRNQNLPHVISAGRGRWRSRPVRRICARKGSGRDGAPELLLGWPEEERLGRKRGIARYLKPVQHNNRPGARRHILKSVQHKNLIVPQANPMDRTKGHPQRKAGSVARRAQDTAASTHCSPAFGVRPICHALT